jgi:hypothetical protein
MADDRDDLEERVEELEGTLRELRDEMRQPPRGPMGLPRPPTPREVLRFTGEYGIPTAIAVLEANLRALEMLQRILRYVDPAVDATTETGDELGSRAQRVSRATLDRLETSLTDLEEAMSEGNLPRESAARNILEEARRLNDDIRDELSAGRERADAARESSADVDAESAGDGRTDGDLGDDAVDIAVSDESDAGESDDAGEEDRPEVDVDAELESIRDQLEERDENSVGIDEKAPDARDTPDDADDADDEGSDAGESSDDSSA